MGIIFSIEEFSTFDGPGIRMSVFLKGCPLRCQWCHNPEGQSYVPQYLRSPNGCLNCGACLEAGRQAAGHPCLTSESIAACPRNLVRLCGYDITPEVLADTIRRKAWMLNVSGGGVTFSGGEPLAQSGFLIACLQLLHGITHRAIQTTGYGDPDIFSEVLQHCDYVLYDLKHMDPDIHKQYTGVDNRQILANYQTLAASGVPFITRVPLIPGVNDTASNIQQTAAYLHSLGVTEVELLPYNRAAGAKYTAIGREYHIAFDPTADPRPHKDIFEAHGIGVKIL